jgi:hypothetical protein
MCMCEVLTHNTSIVKLTFIEGHAMTQAIGSRAQTVGTRVQIQTSPCGICGDRRDTDTGFSASISPFTLSVSLS